MRPFPTTPSVATTMGSTWPVLKLREMTAFGKTVGRAMGGAENLWERWSTREFSQMGLVVVRCEMALFGVWRNLGVALISQPSSPALS